MGQINTWGARENGANQVGSHNGRWLAGWGEQGKKCRVGVGSGRSILVKYSVATRWFNRHNQKCTPQHTHACAHKCAHRGMHVKKHTETHAVACVSVGTTDAVWTVVFSAVKEGPEGLCCLTVHQGSAVTQWHRSPHVTHNAALTPVRVCQCVYVCVCVVGFHHVRYTTADVFMSGVGHCLVWLYAPPQCNMSGSIFICVYTHTHTHI